MVKEIESLRITVETAGKSRKLLSFSLRSNDDVIIDLKPAAKWGSHDPMEPLSEPINYAKISLHPTKKSTTGNLFTVDVKPNVGRSQQFTQALKTYDRFAPVFYRRYPLLREAQVDDGKRPTRSLGILDERWFTLTAGLFISRRTRQFGLEGSDFQVIQQEFGDYNLVFLYSFVSLPALPRASSMFHESTRDGTRPHDRPDGCTDADVFYDFLDFRDRLRSTWAESYALIAGVPLQSAENIAQMSRYFQYGQRSATSEVDSFIERLAPYLPTLLAEDADESSDRRTSA